MESKLSKTATEYLILLILVVFTREVRATVNCMYNEFITVPVPLPVDIVGDQSCVACRECHPRAGISEISSTLALTRFIASVLVLCAGNAFSYYYWKRVKYGELLEDVPVMVQTSDCNQLESPNGHSTPTNLKFWRSGVKVMCDTPELGQELLEKMLVEVCWDWDHYPKLKEREVLLSPVIMLHRSYPQEHQVQQPLRLHVLHSAHYDDQNQNWSVTVLNSNHSNDDPCPSEWTDLSALQDIEVTAGGVEFSVNDLGTYVVVGTPGVDQTLSKKRMCFAAYGETDPRVGCPYSMNLYLLDVCEPSLKKQKYEEESQGRQLMANLRLLHLDVHPKSSISVSIENVSDGWMVTSYNPQKFHCKDWLDSYRRIPKIEAIFEHNNTKRKDFRCLLKLKINDTTTMEVPVMYNVEDYMSESLSTSIQVSDWHSSGVTPVLGGDRKLFELFEENYELEEKVCKKLDREDSFAKVARYYRMDEDDVRIIEERPGKHPTRDVLDFVQSSCNPKLLVSEFFTCMTKIGRFDVSEEIRKYL